MAGIDWVALGREASAKRSALWNAILEAENRLGDTIPDTAPLIKEAYVDLRLDYLTARACLLSSRAPTEDELDEPIHVDSPQLSAFKGQVLTFMAQVEAACIEADGSPDDLELAERMAAQLIQEGRARDPLV